MGVQVGDAHGDRPAQKRAPLVPHDANAPKRPDHQKMKTDCDALREKVNEHRTAIEALKLKIDDKYNKENDPRNKLRQEKRDLINRRVQLNKDIGTLREEQNLAYAKVKDAREATRTAEKEIRQLNRELGDIMTPDMVDKKIKELEFKMESGGVTSINGERKVMREIKDLTAKREKVKEMNDKLLAMGKQMKSGGLSGEDATNKDLQDKIDAKRDEIKVILEKITAVDAEIDTCSMMDEIKELKKARDDENKKIDGLFAKMKEIRDKFDDNKKKYEVYQEEYKKKLDAAYDAKRKEREEEGIRREAAKKERDLALASIKRLNPHEKEINTAETLIVYLKGKIAFTAREERKPAADTKFAADEKAEFAGKKFAVLKKGGDDDSLSFGKKKKAVPSQKDKKPQEKVAVKKPLSHGVEKFEAFKEMGVALPKFTDEVKDAIKLLEEKKAHWCTFKKTEKEAMAEEQAERKKEEAKKAAEEAKAAEAKAAEKKDDDEEAEEEEA